MRNYTKKGTNAENFKQISLLLKKIWYLKDSRNGHFAMHYSSFRDFDDWETSVEFFEFMNSMWGPFTVDRFASHLNSKLSRFNLLFWNPNSEAVDAFSQNWHGENNWLAPLSILYCVR